MTDIRVNGVSLSQRYGFYPDSVGGWLGNVDMVSPSVSVRGRDGGMSLPTTVTDGRIVRISGTMRHDSASDRRGAERELADMVRSARVRIVVDDGLSGAMQIEGRLHSLVTVPFGPSLTPLASRITMEFRCHDEPYWRDVEPMTRAIAAAATRYTIPLGTAPSSAIVRVMGSATTPVVTYRDAGGAVVFTMSITLTLASTEYVDLDMRRGKITKFASGAPTGIHIGTGTFPFALDPQDGDYATSAWPTIEISTGSAEVVWWRRWL